MQRVRVANRGRLLLRIPGSAHSGLAFALMLRPFIPELVMPTDLLSFEHPSVLLFCASRYKRLLKSDARVSELSLMFVLSVDLSTLFNLTSLSTIVTQNDRSMGDFTWN